MTVDIASAWRQIDYRGIYSAKDGIVLHVPHPTRRDVAVCSADLSRATPVTAEGAAIGHCCGICRVRAEFTRLALARGRAQTEGQT